MTWLIASAFVCLVCLLILVAALARISAICDDREGTR